MTIFPNPGNPNQALKTKPPAQEEQSLVNAFSIRPRWKGPSTLGMETCRERVTVFGPSDLVCAHSPRRATCWISLPDWRKTLGEYYATGNANVAKHIHKTGSTAGPTP